MKQYKKSIIPTIESNYDNLTNVEKTIADFFISNNEKMDFSSKNISKLLYVSEASLSRFAKKTGFFGYREFIYFYVKTFTKSEDDVDEHTKEVLNTYQELLNKSYNLIDMKQIKRITKLIATKKKIYVYGIGSSGLVAGEFKMRFMRLGIDVESITDTHMLMMNTVRLNSDCLVVGISISGTTKEILMAMDNAKKREAVTIFITSKNHSVYNDRFDEIVLVSIRKNLEYGNVISPQFPALIIMDIIYAGYIQEHRENIEPIYGTTIHEILERNV